MNGSATLASVWRQQAVWSRTASRLKTAMERARLRILALVVATAVLETLAAQLAARADGPTVWAQVLAGTGAVLMALAAFWQGRARAGNHVSRWIRARSASEALKEQAFRYLTRTGEYDAPDPEAALRKWAEALLADVEDLEAEAARVNVPEREPPAVASLDEYVAARVAQQVEGYYRPRARGLAAERDAWRRGQTLLMLTAAALGALVAYLPEAGIAAWVAVLTTVTGTLAAHVEASRYDQLIVSYRATASRLEWLLAEWRDTLSKQALGPRERGAFVDRCEDAISVENQAWLAGWATSA
jgi:hypothetical protein